MNSLALQAYLRLPYPLKVIAATLRGMQLDWWRYGAETEALTAEALEREEWSHERWASWRTEQLARVLHRAATQVPFYREQWAARRLQGDHASADYLENWPILSKDAVRRSPTAFLADDADRRRLHVEHTSGTTGTSSTLWAGRAAMHRYWALVRARRLIWHGLTAQDPWAIMGGQLVIPSAQVHPPFWVWNAASRQLYLSSYHLMPGSVAAYAEAMRHYGVRYLVGYASSMHSLASLAREQNLALPQLAVAVSNAEPLFDHQREVIATGFGCRVQDTYGMGEMVCAASECAAGTLHLWPEVGVLEVLHHAGPQRLSAGQIGRLVCTGLINTDMLLIRYQVGDSGALASDDQSCSCGRAMPALACVEGRLDDVVITPDGRRIGRLDPVFKADLHILEAQIIQESTQSLRVRFVPSAAYAECDGQRIIRELHERVGQMHIVLEPVKCIERGPNGKFRSVVSHLAGVSQR